MFHQGDFLAELYYPNPGGSPERYFLYCIGRLSVSPPLLRAFNLFESNRPVPSTIDMLEKAIIRIIRLRSNREELVAIKDALPVQVSRMLVDKLDELYGNDWLVESEINS